MKIEERAAAMKPEEIVALLKTHQELQNAHLRLQNELEELARQVSWFRQQLFGIRSERHFIDPEARQLFLGELVKESGDTPAPDPVQIPAHQRRPRHQASAEGSRETELRFDPSVPIEIIQVPNHEITPEEMDQYVLVGQKTTDRLAQRPGSYVVLRFVRDVFKRKSDGEFSCPPAPPAVLEKSCADVSFLAGMLIDKMTYHLPLYRQHQRLSAAGVHLGRSTLTQLFHRTSELLIPIYEAQLTSVLQSKVLAMDETPIKAGHKKNAAGRGQMKVGYFWPIYGDHDEVVFPFATTRSARVVQETLKEYVGVLLTDGYEVYERYAASINGMVHAQCWAHSRRKFFEAEPSEPVLAAKALLYIDALYEHEAKLRSKLFSPEKALAYRGEHSKPIADSFFAWLAETLNQHALLPNNPFTKAAHYTLERQEALQVFLRYPDVPMDTNHLERAIRPIALGRKNWMFCMTEVGAKYVGVVQSLLLTCRLHGIDPYAYLVDVLQRIDVHPAKDVAQLTPRQWKEHFGARPMRSALDRATRAKQPEAADSA